MKLLAVVDPSPAMPDVPADDVEDEPRPSAFVMLESNDVNGADDDDAAGDARFCSDPVIEESNWESVDCTPVPVDVPAAWATAAP